jgi:hypothetical protein
MNFDSTTYRITESGNFGKIALVIGIVGLALSAVGFMFDSTHFYFSYLVAFVFWVTLALGGLFFLMVNHLTGAKWSIVLRRLTEGAAATFPLMLILFIPLVFGLHDLFHWTHTEEVASDVVLKGKSGYLNIPFFLIRVAFYFAAWIIVSRLLIKSSLDQDKLGHSDQIHKRFVRVSAPGMILFAFTVTYASFDWLMSLDAHWYSTIFGAYIFSGAFLGGLCFIIIAGVMLRRGNVLQSTISLDHYHDLAKFVFAFIIFWTYMAFSQYFLIWYGNLPEENYWYLYRWDNTWTYISLIIIFGHFVIPFVGLITRAAKRSMVFLPLMALWILLMHWVDIYWLVMPTHYRTGIKLSWIDVTTFIGIGGVFLWYFWRHFTAHPTVPVKDPGLQTSIQFTNS